MSRFSLPLVSDKDRAEASVVTTKGAGHQFEIQLGHLCNNRCVFCSSGALSEARLARSIRLDPVLEAIEEGRRQGARRITFLGGEPTIHKGFLKALERTVELGFEEVVIFTNGVMLPVPGFIDSVLEIGRSFEWRISIQGGDEAAHVAVTKRKDSFRRIVEGLETLRARGQKVTANMCVNELSYRSLEGFPALVREYGLRQLHIDMIRPPSMKSEGLEALGAIQPRYSDMAPHFERMLAAFDAWDPAFDVNVGNLPHCVLPAWSDRIHHGGEETITRACDENGLEVEVDKYEWHASMRRHLPGCEGCVFRSECLGVFPEYLALHGDAEFSAVTPEMFSALGPRHAEAYARRRSRAMLARMLSKMHGLEKIEGWTLSSFSQDEERGELVFRREGASLFVELLCAPKEGRANVALSSRIGPGTDARAARRVLDALARSMRE